MTAETPEPGASPSENGDLSPRHHRFVEEYLVDLNASQAAIRAGYSQNCCRSIGSKLMNRADVARAIDIAMATDPGVTRTRIVDELAKTAFADPRASRVKIRDKLTALEMLGKTLGMFKERHELTGVGGTALVPVLNVTYGSGQSPPAS